MSRETAVTEAVVVREPVRVEAPRDRRARIDQLLRGEVK
jgi:hypothetical protein